MPRQRLFFLLLCLAAAAVAQQQESFEEQLLVREVELVYDDGDDLVFRILPAPVPR